MKRDRNAKDAKKGPTSQLDKSVPPSLVPADFDGERLTARVCAHLVHQEQSRDEHHLQHLPPAILHHDQSTPVRFFWSFFFPCCQYDKY